uniref:Uncharacterized protein n=1 Tax=Arundo donax TaxID=35708 RepID=A0A0A9HD59_ARUDO
MLPHVPLIIRISLSLGRSIKTGKTDFREIKIWLCTCISRISSYSKPGTSGRCSQICKFLVILPQAL